LAQYEIRIEDFMTDAVRSVFDICEDANGRLWLATYWGLAMLDKNTTSFQWVHPQSNDPSNRSHNTALAVHIDRSANLWVGTSGYGLNQCDLKEKQFRLLKPSRSRQPLPNDFSVYEMGEDGEGSVWFAANRMVYRFDWRTGRLEPRPLGFIPNRVNAMLKDHGGALWIANDFGVHRYLAGSDRVEQIFPEPAAERIITQVVYEDRAKDVWFGGLYGNRNFPAALSATTRELFRWHRRTGLVSAYSIALPDKMRDSRLEFHGIHQDSSGAFWLATNFGLLRFDPASGVSEAFGVDEASPNRLTSRDLKSLLADPEAPNRFLWLGTNGGGLNRFDCTTSEFIAYMQREGLPNNVVYGILSDGPDFPLNDLKEDRGHLWLSTNKGLSKATLTSDTREIAGFRNYDARDGLQSDEFNTLSYCKTANGEFFFGGVKGLNYFHPDSIKDNPFPPQVVITDFQIRHQSIRHEDGDSPLSHPVALSEAITVSYADNVLTFEFAALDYSAPEKNLYSYKLEGFDSHWRAPGLNRRATYTNLDPGEYVFRVRGSNNDSVWNEAGAEIKLIVTPPWWRTWWAYSLFAAVSLGLLYLLRKYEKNRQALRHRLELEQVEAEKLHELDRLKSRFFANISHEFRTPLTLIMGQLDSMKAAAAEAKLKTKLDMAWRNAQQLLRLINQLLDLSKLEAGRMELRAVFGNIVPLLQRLTNSFESVAGLKRIQLRFASASAEFKIYHEPEKIENIMHNLLSNAIKFTPEGGSVLVRVEVGREAKGEERGAKGDGRALHPSPFKSPSATAASAFPRNICRTSSTVSIKPTAPPRASTRARALAWR
jgi:signal transduction histidine kinase/streptogramin lyase